MILPNLTKAQSKSVYKTIGLHTRKCVICGKEFDAGKKYAYKDTPSDKPTVYYCSYSCFRENHK